MEVNVNGLFSKCEDLWRCHVYVYMDTFTNKI